VVSGRLRPCSPRLERGDASGVSDSVLEALARALQLGVVGELSTQSEAFRTRWATHNVRFHNTGVKHFNHPAVGDLDLTYNRLDLAADPGLTLFTYTAEPGSRSEETLTLLGSWAATADPAELARAIDPS
jgi:hypothetical protein